MRALQTLEKLETVLKEKVWEIESRGEDFSVENHKTYQYKARQALHHTVDQVMDIVEEKAENLRNPEEYQKEEI